MLLIYPILALFTLGAYAQLSHPGLTPPPESAPTQAPTLAPNSTIASGLTTKSTSSSILSLSTTTSAPASSSTIFPDLGGVSQCVTTCIQDSVAKANCTTITNVACVCASAKFKNATVTCVSQTCPSDLSNAETLAQKFCDIISVSLTFPPGPSSTAGSSPSSPVGNDAAAGPALGISAYFVGLLALFASGIATSI